MSFPDGLVQPSDTLAERVQAGLGTSYRIRRELGGGGMSRVFLAEDTALGRDVVVKVLREELVEGISRERFRRELLVSANLQHPNIVGVIAAGEAGGLPYFVMPYVDGESLRARIRRDGPLPIPSAVAIIRDVARALSFAHSRGIIHRDIKPDNVLIAGGAASVADFGVAKAVVTARATERHPHGSLTGAGVSLGTPAYMAPEQVAGDPETDHRADIYALGATAHEMLTGVPPFGHRPVAEQLTAHLSEGVKPPSLLRPGLPAALEKLVVSCLAKDPKQRPQSADEILAFLDDPAVVSGAVSSSATASRAVPRRRPSARLLAVAGVVVVAGVLAWAAVWPRSEQVAPASDTPVQPTVTQLAVFPLVSLSADSADALVARGLTEALLSAFSGIAGVRVASPSGAEADLRAGSTPVAIAARWGVTAFYEGTLQRSGARIRVTLRLVNVADGFMLWSDVYEREGGDPLVVQSEIASEAAAAFRSGPEASGQPGVRG